MNGGEDERRLIEGQRQMWGTWGSLRWGPLRYVSEVPNTKVFKINTEI